MDLHALYGTDAPPARVLRIVRGDAAVTLEDGALRHLTVGGMELLRGIAFLVRDRDWGTLPPDLRDLTVLRGDDATHMSYRAGYAAGGARLDVTVDIRLGDGVLDMSAVAQVTGDFETNRTGFSVLHPIDGVAGASLRVTHGDGTVTETTFPALIAPWQPVMDIAALSHRAGDWQVDCHLDGDVFEMEDQRQWGDASYKTYVRPLARPWPYVLADGSALRQAVRLRWVRASVAAAPVPPVRAVVTAAHFPQTALAITAADVPRALAAPQDVQAIAPQRFLCHLDASAGQGRAELAGFAALQAAHPDIAVDLELVARCPAGGDLAAEFSAYAADVAAEGLRPASVMVCPAVDRQSTPPGSAWPPCPPLEEIYRAARLAFGGVPLGGGSASFFPELNRKRPPVALLDYVTHGFCPIVHAADDLSVIESLQSVPHILHSARAIIGDRDYRLGPSTIAMRQNPYGSRTIPNPARGRVPMADADPRQDGAFAAAWTLGLAAAIAPAGLTVWTPAALYGPRGLYQDDGTPRPVAWVVAALAACAGQAVHRADLSPDLAGAVLECGDRHLRANLTARAQDGLGPFGCGGVGF